MILGGGLPIGSILLVEEDKMVRYSEYLTKFYLAESAVHSHGIYLASLDTDPNSVVTIMAMTRIFPKYQSLIIIIRFYLVEKIACYYLRWQQCI